MKKVLGDIVGGFPGENTPLVPRVLPPGPAGWRTTGLRLASRLAPRRRTGGATAARGDIIIRYERVYEAANHSHVHISNGRSPRYSV